ERDGLYAQMWTLQEQERALRRSERRAGLRALNLAPLISGAIEAVRGDLDAKGIELYTTIGLDVGLVTGDPSALQDVVWGLLGRAVQVSEPGARVEVSLERAGNEVLLKVVDTSGAPPPTEQPRIPLEHPTGELARFDLRTLSAIVEEH